MEDLGKNPCVSEVNLKTLRSIERNNTNFLKWALGLWVKWV